MICERPSIGDVRSWSGSAGWSRSASPPWTSASATPTSSSARWPWSRLPSCGSTTQCEHAFDELEAYVRDLGRRAHRPPGAIPSRREIFVPVTGPDRRTDRVHRLSAAAGGAGRIGHPSRAVRRHRARSRGAAALGGSRRPGAGRTDADALPPVRRRCRPSAFHPAGWSSDPRTSSPSSSFPSRTSVPAEGLARARW